MGLLKKAKIQGARGDRQEDAIEAYLSRTLKESRRGQRSRLAFFNSPRPNI